MERAFKIIKRLIRQITRSNGQIIDDIILVYQGKERKEIKISSNKIKLY